MSGLLANREKTEDLWNQVRDSIGCALERDRGVKKMMHILSLNYFDLPPHLKSCLLYMCIFPEDYLIRKKFLIWRWIAKGFIQKEARYTLYEIGKRYFNELLNRSLIQAMHTSENGKVKVCCIHDTILDFIISKSVEEHFVTILGAPMLTASSTQSKVRRLSLQGNRLDNPATQKSGLVFSHVRSLNVFGETPLRAIRFWHMSAPPFDQFRYLRVLDLEYSRGLNLLHLDSMTKLFQLRYLNLKATEIRELPEEIGRLRCLQMLNIIGTYVHELPSSIIELGKLLELLIDTDAKFPAGIAKMQALETLKDVNVSKQPLEFLWGLGELKGLRKLGLSFYEDEHAPDECIKAIASSLCKLGTQNLHSLVIYAGSSLLKESLCMPTFKKLVAWDSPVEGVPNWVSSLRNLQQLTLEVEQVIESDLRVLGALPTLLSLHLKEATMTSDDLRINAELGFRSLRSFCYDTRYHKVDLVFAAGSMPKLQRLQLHDIGLVKTDCLDFGITNLLCLKAVECTVCGDHGIVEAVKTAIERAISRHPNHPSLDHFSVVDEPVLRSSRHRCTWSMMLVFSNHFRLYACCSEDSSEIQSSQPRQFPEECVQGSSEIQSSQPRQFPEECV